MIMRHAAGLGAHFGFAAALVGAALLSTSDACAGLITWNFGTNPTSTTNAVDFSEVPGAIGANANWLGHAATWGSGASQVTVQAFSLPLPPASLPAASNAYISQADLNANATNAGSAGIGVCSSAQVNANNRAVCNTAADGAQIDNVGGAYDVLVFGFAEASTPISIEISGWNNGDSLELWGGQSDLSSLAMSATSFVAGHGNPHTVQISATEAFDYLVVGSSRSAPFNDEFRVLRLVVVPEPTSLALLAAALLGLAVVGRFRKL